MTTEAERAKYASSWSTPGSAVRNAPAISSALSALLPREGGVVLEVASGFGEQVARIAADHPWLEFQPTEADSYLCSQIDATCAAAGVRNVRRARVLDIAQQHDWLALRDSFSAAPFAGVLACNLTHVAPWSTTQSLLAHLDTRLPVPVLQNKAFVAFYGAFNEHGAFTSDANRKFDETIRARNPAFGLRDVQADLVPLAERHGLVLQDRIAMPAGNLLLHFRVKQSCIGQLRP